MASVPSNGRPRPPRRAAAATVAASLCASVLAACGGSSGGSGSSAVTTTIPVHAPLPSLPAGSPEKAACGLITQAEVEAAVGAKVGPGKEDAQAARSLCSFPLLSTPEQSVVLVSTTSAGVPDFFTTVRDRATAPQSVAAGDQAFVSGGQGLVRKGTTMVAILVVLRQGPAQLVAAATKLTQAVGARL